MNELVIGKLRKLLSLATSNNPHEAELAMEKAQEIAMNHQIDLASIDMNGKSPNINVVQERMEFGQRFPTVLIYVNSIIGKFFNVSILEHGNRIQGRSVSFIGLPEDVSMAKFVYGFLSEAMQNCWNKYYASTFNANLKDKAGYFLGFYNGLVAKLQKNKEMLESKITDGRVANNYQLAIINRQELIKLYMETTFTGIKKVARKDVVVRDRGAYAAGVNAGDACELVRGNLK
jgi:hypothetical protein